MATENTCSIIIPVHNKAALTRQCLESIFAAPPEVGFEVVVVDDSSSDTTPAMLESYGDRVRSVRLEQNSGFATACNAGAAAAEGRYLVLLNNDTITEDGWLDALARYADDHPEAAVVGSRLLYPDRTIQHAGVAFSVSGDPLHVYVGFPPEHPAVMKPRRFQAVTAACMLIRAGVFDEFGGFDTDYHNDLEDVDLCLRLGEQGHEVHYCPASVLYHLESASRAAHFHEGRSAKLYRERWGARVRSDELAYYLEDGLLDLLRFSPELVKGDGGRRKEAEVLQIRSRQMLELLREVIRSSGREHANGSARPRRGGGGSSRPRIVVGAAARRGRTNQRADEVAEALRAQLADALPHHQARPATPASPTPPSSHTRPPGYAGVVVDVVDAVRKKIPEGSTVLVVSKGDDQLLDIGAREGWHFPRAEDGRYRGYYPAGDDDAIAHFEELRASGAEYLVLPRPAFWWIEHYPGFARHLNDRYGAATSLDSCMIFDLRTAIDAPAPAVPAAPLPDDDTDATPARPGLTSAQYAALVERVHALVEASVPAGATVLVVSRGDDALLELGDRRAWHFPRADDGRYRGYYPADDDDAIEQLEQLRSSGAQYLVIPSVGKWWLDHYAGFAAHLRSRAVTAGYDHDTGLVFELEQPLLPSIVGSLLPAGSRVAVLSQHRADLAGLTGYDALQLSAATPGEAIDELERLAGEGVEFLVIPRSSFAWHEDAFEVVEHLRSHHRFITRQEQAGELWELEAMPAADMLERHSEPRRTGKYAERPHDAGARRFLGIFPLSWKRGGDRKTDA